MAGSAQFGDQEFDQAEFNQGEGPTPTPTPAGQRRPSGQEVNALFDRKKEQPYERGPSLRESLLALRQGRARRGFAAASRGRPRVTTGHGVGRGFGGARRLGRSHPSRPAAR